MTKVKHFHIIEVYNRHLNLNRNPVNGSLVERLWVGCDYFFTKPSKITESEDCSKGGPMARDAPILRLVSAHGLVYITSHYILALWQLLMAAFSHISKPFVICQMDFTEPLRLCLICSRIRLHIRYLPLLQHHNSIIYK